MKPGIGLKGGSPPTGLQLGGLDAHEQAVIRVAHRYDAPPACVFDAWLDPEIAGKWLFATAWRPIAHPDIDARVGGTFCFVDRHAGETIAYTGEYLEIVPRRRLVFTLVMPSEPSIVTRVTVEIAPLKQGCALRLTHENVPQEHASQIEGRWTGILYGLDVTLDPVCTPVNHDQE